eukprot:gene866-160_t
MPGRVLLFDSSVTAKGLSPEEVAKHRQSIQIYNPQSEKYVMIESSSPVKSKDNYVCLDENYKGGDKVFLLEHLDNNDYHIKTVNRDDGEETGYLYVSEHVSSGIMESSANVLWSNKITGNSGLYVFQFIRHCEQRGVYKIKCKGNGKLIYGSTDRGHRVKADKRDREKTNQIWFQLSLKPHRDIKVSVVEDNRQVMSGSDDLPVYIDEFYNDSKYEYTQPCDDGIPKISSLLEKMTVNKNAALKAESDLFCSSSDESPFTLNPGKRISKSSSVNEQAQLIEKKLEIEFGGNKFEGYSFSVISGSKFVTINEDGLEEALQN